MPIVKNKKILIVDDDHFLVKIISNRLKEEGFEIEIARDGQEGFEKITQGHFDFVTMDLMMPRMNGFQVLEALQAKKNKTPVVIFSSLAQESDKKEVLRLGAKGYFVKSEITIEEVVAAVHKLLV